VDVLSDAGINWADVDVLSAAQALLSPRVGMLLW